MIIGDVLEVCCQ